MQALTLPGLKSATIAATGAAAVLIALTTGSAVAYERYLDGCQFCHGDFTGGTSPQGTVFPSNDKHRMHRDAAYMAADCNLCHSEGDNDNPFIGSSDGTPNNPGVGCTGCHGRDYGGALGDSGVGLRAHHFVTGTTSCVGCHPGDPTPLPENVRPTYYGTVDTRVDDSCNSAPAHLESWSLNDTRGLDNDGDNVYDEADSDCGPACLGDLDQDLDVDLSDLAQLLGNYGTPSGAVYEDGDLDADGDVDLSDLAALLGEYGTTCP
jgi:hypothetical protein